MSDGTRLWNDIALQAATTHWHAIFMASPFNDCLENKLKRAIFLTRHNSTNLPPKRIAVRTRTAFPTDFLRITYARLCLLYGMAPPTTLPLVAALSFTNYCYMNMFLLPLFISLHYSRKCSSYGKWNSDEIYDVHMSKKPYLKSSIYRVPMTCLCLVRAFWPVSSSSNITNASPVGRPSLLFTNNMPPSMTLQPFSPSAKNSR